MPVFSAGETLVAKSVEGMASTVTSSPAISAVVFSASQLSIKGSVGLSEYQMLTSMGASSATTVPGQRPSAIAAISTSNRQVFRNLFMRTLLNLLCAFRA